MINYGHASALACSIILEIRAPISHSWAMRVASLNIFPVKSMAGFSRSSARVNSWGLEGDRRWMVITPEGRFLTQRDTPGMALMAPDLRGPKLRLEAPGLGAIEAAATGPLMDVRVWNDMVPAATCPGFVDDFVTTLLGRPCRLVYLNDPSSRKVDSRWRQADETVSFADGFPVLLTSFGSLDDLNARLAAPIRINRFRGNIEIEDAPAWAEDSWMLIRIGDVTFRVAKPCERCVVTTIEQETAARPDKAEPLRTLATFRRAAEGVIFGQNLVPVTEGDIGVGDPIEILEQRASNLGNSMPRSPVQGWSWRPQQRGEPR